MAKIGVIGDSASVLGFKAFGLETFACEDVSRRKATASSILPSVSIRICRTT